jgi:hypothetical protein
MQPQSKRTKKNGLTFMLLDGAGGNARRFQITSRHLLVVAVLWVLGLLLFAYLGFQIG